MEKYLGYYRSASTRTTKEISIRFSPLLFFLLKIMWFLTKHKKSDTSGCHAELFLQSLVLSPEESHLLSQLTLLLVAVDEDVGGCWTWHIHMLDMWKQKTLNSQRQFFGVYLGLFPLQLVSSPAAPWDGRWCEYFPPDVVAKLWSPVDALPAGLTDTRG